MQSEFRAANPGEIEMTLTVTMTIRGWDLLREQLNQSRNSLLYPANDLISSIDEMTRKAACQFEFKAVGDELPKEKG